MSDIARVRIKFCGMTNVADALKACELGVDAIGLIFHGDSPRNVTIEQAAHISKQLPPYVSKVGVFVNPTTHFVTSVLQAVQLDILQFHGQELAPHCRCFDKPYIKVIPVGSEAITREIEDHYSDAAGFLFDTQIKGQPGGTGIAFNWDNLPSDLTKPLILAGGLTQDNLAEALTKVHPYGIDVTSGIEKSKGIKDFAKMKFFVDTVMDYCKRS
jgi:phosphoribosylanthranilate isomerase